MIKKYIMNILIAIDQLINAILLGDPDETISSRIGKHIRRKDAGWFLRAIAWVLDKLDPHHCEDAIEEDEGKDAIIE